MPTISEHDALPAGFRLGEFEIHKVLGIGGFGIVYLAFDHALERQVAIKEYMPAALAGRGAGQEVVVRSVSHAETFALGMRSFINEARLLARFDHPALVKVYRFWEAHGTAYMVMPYYQGQTLQQVRRAMDTPPDEIWLRRLITPLLGALECLHRENVFHRDVAPDNILLLDDEFGPAMGRPVLLDLGAARRVIGDHTQTLTAIVKPSFAPIEQYAETALLRQGPWTDLYALAAVVHYCVTGRPPMPSTARAVHDEMPTLRQLGGGLANGFERHYSEAFIAAIDHAMAVRPQDRPPSIPAWREMLSGVASEWAHGVAEGDAQERGWVSQTVAVRPSAGLAPLGHGTLDAHAYMTTIPAANALRVPPTWAPGNLGHMGPHLPDDSDGPVVAPLDARAEAFVEDTMVIGPPASSPVSQPPLRTTTPVSQAPAPARSDDAGKDAFLEAADANGASSRAWMKWGTLGAVLLTAVAIWGLQSRAPRGNGVSAVPAAAALAAKAPSGVGEGKPADKVVAKAGDKVGAGKLVAGRPADDKADIALAANKPVVMKPVDDKAIDSKDTVLAAASTADEPIVSKPQHASKSEGTRVRREETRAAYAQEPRNPRRACGGRTFILLAICMKSHCARSDYAHHPECERMRQQEAAQRASYP